VIVVRRGMIFVIVVRTVDRSVEVEVKVVGQLELVSVSVVVVKD
jgi:hypothetical protein